LENGAIAQLGERFNGIEEVVGSIPSGSTNFRVQSDDSAAVIQNNLAAGGSRKHP
jgi:hypothetical protein